MSRNLGNPTPPVGLIVIEAAIPNTPLVLPVGIHEPVDTSLEVVEGEHISKFSGFWEAKIALVLARRSQGELPMARIG